jgi:hypothetical protein
MFLFQTTVSILSKLLCSLNRLLDCYVETGTGQKAYGPESIMMMNFSLLSKNESGLVKSPACLSARVCVCLSVSPSNNF